MEKEKLLLVAAQHLDSIHKLQPALIATTSSLPKNISLMSMSENNYDSEKLLELEMRINELLDEFQSVKCIEIETSSTLITE